MGTDLFDRSVAKWGHLIGDKFAVLNQDGSIKIHRHEYSGIVGLLSGMDYDELQVIIEIYEV